MLKAIKLLKKEPSCESAKSLMDCLPTTSKEPHFISNGFWIPLAESLIILVYTVSLITEVVGART